MSGERYSVFGRELPIPAKVGQLGLIAIGIAFFLSVPSIFSSVDVSRMADGGVFILLALGLNIVVGYAGLLDLGYAAFFAIGAYTYAILASSHYNIHLAFWPLLLIAAIVAALFGVILGAPTLRLRGDYLAIVTLGFGEIVPRVVLNLEGVTGGVNGLSGLDQPKIPALGPFPALTFGYNPIPYYYTILGVIILSIIIIRNLQYSRLGRAWQAIREDELAAASMGINTVTTKLLAFAMGAAFSGFGGCFYASKLALVTPEAFTFVISVTILCMVVLGGMGNIAGVIVGAAAIYALTTYVLIQLPLWMTGISQATGFTLLNTIDFTQYNFIIFGLLLISFMLLRPQGLLPSRVRRAELKHGDIAGSMGAQPETVTGTSSSEDL
ncbi:MAG: branched-chain amino acid transport system permease protein [Chloroflexota bacterium]|jgi:branched-chain amino acid transport system permease protein|nr:branched-chain amino acid transport system permease protein [Chloroflexota bacterium]